MKCDWLQIMTDNQINPYDWLDLTSISLEKSKGQSLDFITNIKHTNKGEAFKS